MRKYKAKIKERKAEDRRVEERNGNREETRKKRRNLQRRNDKWKKLTEENEIENTKVGLKKHEK